MFTADEIEARLRRQPFVPVRVVTSLGQNYDITHTATRDDWAEFDHDWYPGSR